LDTEIDPDAFAVLIFTSGTTSQSKGVMISNTNLAYNINAVTHYVSISPDDRLFSVLPLHHTYESTIGFLYPMAMGASVAVCQGLKHIAGDMKETSPTAILAVPLLIEALYKKINQSIEKSGKATAVKSMIYLTNGLKNLGVDVKRKVFRDIYDNLGGKLRIIVTAAAPIEAHIGKWFEDIGLLFLQGYGLTETAPIAALTPDYDTRVGSAGKAVVCDEIKIKNPNENGEGEVLIKGKTVMLGYYENPEATAEVMQDGWFNSGDIGYLDEDGFLYITGRSKNVIVTQNGKNIYPEEIEGLISKIPEIAECMVYGKEVVGEKELIITARVIPNYDEVKELHGDNLSEDKIYSIIWDKIKKVNRKLSAYKTVKKLEIKHDEFEKTSTMKIKRYAELAKDKAASEENEK
jgi:long-chain acyl-CoA synthetase